MWVLIDNYDSFSYMLLDYLKQIHEDCRIFRNDEISVAELAALNPERIIISPGPETPLQSGICMEVIKEFHGRVPILGICLGHQALGMFFGGRLKHAPIPRHGKISDIRHTGNALFDGVFSPFKAMRYHSLVIDQLEETGFETVAVSDDDEQVMAIIHKDHPCVGLQFHPESVGTEDGLRILRNWSTQY